VEVRHHRLGEGAAQAGAAALGRHGDAADPAAGAEVGAGGDPDQLAVQVGHEHLATEPGAGEADHAGQAGGEAGARVQAAEPGQLLLPGRPDRGPAGGDRAHVLEEAAGQGTAPKRRWRVW
jgi:hypothetical protein